MSSGWETFAKTAVRSAAVAAVGLAVQQSAGYRAAQRVIWIGIGGTGLCVLLGAMYSLPIMYVLAVGCLVAAGWAYEVGCREQRRLREEQQALQPSGSNQPWTPEAEAWADAYARAQQPTHRRVTRTVAVANRPPEAAQRPQETYNDVAAPTQQPTRPTLILPRYSGPKGRPRHAEDHGFFTIDDFRGFDPDLGE